MTGHARSLDQLGSVSRGRSRHRPRNAPHLYGGAYPFIQTGDVKHAGLYITKWEQTYNEKGLEQSKLWPAGTLCITIAANIADTAILGIDACFPDSIIGFIADPKQADTRFIKYLFDSAFQRHFKQFTQGAAQDNLSQEKLLSLKLKVPPVEEQTKIADLLSKYDNLIENNLRRIALLEKSARLLYREWFVHLRFPGYEHTRITNGIPVGWSKKNLTDIAVINESSLKNGFHGNIEYIDISCVSTNSINSTTWYDFKEAPGRARRVLKHGDIIWSCVRPNLKAHSFVWQPHDRLIASTGFAVISAKFISPFYLYQVLTTNEYVSYLTNHAGGAAYPAVTAKVFENSEILVPPTNLLDDFDQFVEKIYRQINLLHQSNKKLIEARDLLLPRLMNGEISV